jgi:hypothetical protein
MTIQERVINRDKTYREHTNTKEDKLALKCIAYLKLHLESKFDNIDKEVLREVRALNKTIKVYYGE